MRDKQVETCLSNLDCVTVGGIISTLFLGGWRGPGAETYPILGVFYFFIKAFFLYWVIMWVKYSLPRIRIDHMLNLNWKFLTPLSLAILIVTAILDKILPRSSEAIYALGMLAANVVVGWITLQLLRLNVRSERKRVAEPKPVAQPETSVAAVTSQTSSSSS